MSKTDSLHYKLCCEGAKWLNNRPWSGYKYVAVELICASSDNPDIWGTNGFSSAMIEVKVSRSDFLNDKKKFVRQPENAVHAVGNHRYYLCPKGIINIDDLPEGWGLLWYDKGEISIIKEAAYLKTYNRGELSILSSIMRREGIKGQVFNYRKINEKSKS